MCKKQELRGIAAGIAPEDRSGQDKKIQDRILESRWWRDAATVFCYVSTDSEPDTHILLKQALEQGKTVLVPKCVSRTEMVTVRIRSLEELKTGTWGIMEPEGNEVWSGQIDLAVVPCVAVTKNGVRLGHGAGYYDRFLQESKVKKICLCYAERVFEKIPCGQTDIRMDAVVTPNETYIIKRKEEEEE